MTAVVARSPRVARVEPTCCHEDPEMYPEFLPAGSPLAFPCTDPATVYLFRPASGAHCWDDSEVGAFCDFHAAIQGPLDRVAIADLPLVCAGCGEPVWLAHPATHAVGAPCHGCQQSSPDHPACSCPDAAAYEAAMLAGGAM